MRWVRRLIGVALAVAGMVGGWKFAAENSLEVPVSYVWGVVELPVWQALGLCFGAGFALGALGWVWVGLRSRLVQRRYRKAVGGLEAEVHQLRNLPLAPDAGAPGDPPAPGAPPAGERGP